MLVIIASGLLIIDQITKFRCEKPHMDIMGPRFRGVLDFVQNRGAAFSLFQ